MTNATPITPHDDLEDQQGWQRVYAAMAGKATRDRDLSALAQMVMVTISIIDDGLITPDRVIQALPGSAPDDIVMALDELHACGYLLSRDGQAEEIKVASWVRTTADIAAEIESLTAELAAKRAAQHAHREKAAEKMLELLGMERKQFLPAKYVDPVTGATWAGRGKTPKWIASGNRDDYLIRA